MVQYHFIIPNNTNWQDTTNPVFYGFIWGLVALAFTYVSFMFLARTADSILNNKKLITSGRITTLRVDVGLQALFGFIIMAAMFVTAWTLYIGNIYANYYPFAADGTTTTKGYMTLPQDIYSIVLTSLTMFYLFSMYVYRWYIVSLNGGEDYIREYKISELADAIKPKTDRETDVWNSPDSSDLKPEDKLKALGEDKNRNAGTYVLRYSIPMLCTLALVLWPGFYAYAANRTLITNGAWMVLVTAIALTACVGGYYFAHVKSKTEHLMFTNTSVIVFSYFDNLHSHSINGHIITQHFPVTFMFSYIFYVFASEMMIYGDPMKPTANFFVRMLAPLIMSFMAQNKGTFFPFHVAMTFYFITYAYLLESIYPPYADTTADYLFNTTDANFMTTGPDYLNMNDYNTSFQLMSGMGMALSFIALILAGILYMPMTVAKGSKQLANAVSTLF